MTAGIVVVGSLLVIGTLVFAGRVSERWVTLFRWVRIVSAGLVLLFGGAVIGPRIWDYAQGLRPEPEAVEEELFPGITYLRDVRENPQPMVIHIVRVELDAPGIGFLVTPGDPGADRPFQAQRTSDFLDQHGLQVAINAGFYKPSHDVSPLDYFPHVGDRVEVDGDTSSQGELIPTRSTSDYRTLYLSATNEATFKNPGQVYNAISGSLIFVERGEQGTLDDHPYITQPQPRTAVALDEQGETLLLVVVDGLQSYRAVTFITNTLSSFWLYREFSCTMMPVPGRLFESRFSVGTRCSISSSPGRTYCSHLTSMPRAAMPASLSSPR